MTKSDTLPRILDDVRKRLAIRMADLPLDYVQHLAQMREPGLDFVGALRGPRVAVIAEIKRASPSKGTLNDKIDAARQARLYEASGAACISVLTEEDSFRGSLRDLDDVRAAVRIPILRKDFIVSEYQVWESRAHGADAVLLIVAALARAELNHLMGVCAKAGIVPLVEIHDEDEMEIALSCDARLIGINNRNLRTMKVSIEVTRRLRQYVPDGVTVVSESGIGSALDMRELDSMRVHAALIGEAIVAAENSELKLKELVSYGQD